MWKTLLGIINKSLEAWNAWRQKQRDDGLVTTGRQLQAADALQATNKEAIDARKSDAAVAGLSDADLDSELRGGSKTNPGG